MNNTRISSILARQIIDSRGNPTVEADVYLEDGTMGRAAVPSGASTGKKEALELRDKDASRFHGKSVSNALTNIQKLIEPELKGEDALEQQAVDQKMLALDATENKSKLGANAMLAVSMANLRAAANASQKPLFSMFGETFLLPTPMMNVINGGAHADNNLDIQEFMIVPHGFDTFAQSLQAGCEIFHTLKGILHSAGKSTNVGDEGGFAPAVQDTDQALDYLMQAIEKSAYKPGQQVSLALDVASSEFYDEDKNQYISTKNTSWNKSCEEMISFYDGLLSNYPIVSIEDALAEDDWDGWQLLTQKLGDKCQWVGDDLFVTNPRILSQGIEQKCANAILIKVNQIGTVTETLETIEMAKKAQYNNVISHRSGETEDTFISDLAVGTQAGQIKTGSLSRSDRVAKYNELLRIEEKLASGARFASGTPFTR